MEDPSTNDENQEFSFLRFVTADEIIKRIERKFKKLKLKKINKDKEDKQ
jgi:hypothetical protein